MHKIQLLGCRLSIVLFISITFISCVSVTPSIPANAMESAQTVDIYIGHPQHPLVYQRQAKGAKTGALIAGVLGILVAETISRSTHKKWEEPGRRIAAHLKGLDHAAQLEELLRQNLDQTEIKYNIYRVDELHDIFQRNEVIKNILESTKADIVIALSYDYSLQQGFDLHISGHSEAYAASDLTEQFADTKQRIVYRLLDDMVFMEDGHFTAVSPDEMADVIIEADARVVSEQLDNATQRVAAEVISLLGHSAAGNHTAQYNSGR